MTYADHLPEHRAPGLALDRNGLQILERDECLRLLAGVAVARVGVNWDALPAVVPVNVVLASLADHRDQELVIRSVEGTKLFAALRRAVIAVEADDIEPFGHTGWSVLVRGETRVLDDADEVQRARELPLRSWASSKADRFIAVRLDMVSGRRIPIAPDR